MSLSSSTLDAKRPHLRIAVLNRIFESSGGGAERYSIALVEQLALRHEIHVFAQKIKHDMPGVTYHRVSMPLAKPRWINQLWYAFVTWRATREGFDIVHSHENTWHGQVQTVHVLPVKHNLFLGRSGVRRGLRWVKVFSSPRLLTYLWLERQRFKAQGNRRVVVTSASLGDTLVSTYPEVRRPCPVITPGVLMPQTSGDDAHKRAARTQLDLPQSVPCLLFVGNDYRKKGLGSLLGALQVLPADVVLAVVGNPAQTPEFSRLASSAGLAGRVFFLGALADVGPAYRAADCLVHPTLEDTFAMVVLEAMAHALPVVVSSAGYCGISALLQHGHNALILQDPRNTDQLTQAIGRILADGVLRQTLSAQAREFASRYQWPEIARQQEAVYYAAQDSAPR
jgi:glycosyltransferase involved in cell wall biosynthesis